MCHSFVSKNFRIHFVPYLLLTWKQRIVHRNKPSESSHRMFVHFSSAVVIQKNDRFFTK